MKHSGLFVFGLLLALVASSCEIMERRRNQIWLKKSDRLDQRRFDLLHPSVASGTQPDCDATHRQLLQLSETMFQHAKFYRGPDMINENTGQKISLAFSQKLNGMYTLFLAHLVDDDLEGALSVYADICSEANAQGLPSDFLKGHLLPIESLAFACRLLTEVGTPAAQLLDQGPQNFEIHLAWYFRTPCLTAFAEDAQAAFGQLNHPDGASEMH